MKKQIHLDLHEEVEIYVAGKKVLTIDSVSDEKVLDLYLYSEYFSPLLDGNDLADDGCFGELIAGLG